FSAFATTAAVAMVPMPAGFTFEEAATVPIAYLTAHYALHHLARLRAGERVLIQAAAGGVGLAAVRLAQRAGAQIFATPGGPEKRAFLLSQGVRQVMDSRSLAFAEEVLARTAGEGVDVVLNSLAGEFITRGLSTLRPGGRFLEIGKVDVLRNTPLGLGHLDNNLALFTIDLLQISRSHPELLNTLLTEAAGLAREGGLGPLPSRVFPISEVGEAFRYMAQAKHIGKVVLTLQEAGLQVRPAAGARRTLRPDATYLVTGGLGGLGLKVAEWMGERGARHLVLVGRSGAATPAAAEAVAALRGAG